MADQEKDKRVDKMLDSLLANYSSAEPRPGLETRILASLRETPEKETAHGWWNFKWLSAGMVAAVIIAAAVLIGGRHRIAPPTHVIVKTSPAIPQPNIQPRAPAVRNETVKIRPRKPLAPTRPQNAALALNERPAVFPTPTPLSEQEKLLLSYLAGTPREQVIAQSHPDEPPVVGDQDQTEAIPDPMHIPQKLSNTR
ncbi:MAG: hypothetical protein LAO76_23975 [Acidobacteriia bacterium]|nr:hypothetical protein [Terriglobia bacterium]